MLFNFSAALSPRLKGNPNNPVVKLQLGHRLTQGRPEAEVDDERSVFSPFVRGRLGTGPH